MDDATYRRKADKLLRACSNNGNLGHCIGCDKFVASGVKHTAGCPVEELLLAGPTSFTTAMLNLAESQGVFPVPPWRCTNTRCVGTADKPCDSGPTDCQRRQMRPFDMSKAFPGHCGHLGCHGTAEKPCPASGPDPVCAGSVARG